MIPKRYSIAEARHNLAAIVHELEAQPLIELTRRGEPVAVLLEIDAYRRLRGGAGGFWELYELFRSSVDASALAGPDDPFADLRDPAPGREPAL